MSALLQVNHLKKYFQVPQGVLHAVDDVSFELKKGKTLGIVGESGCGKSTLGKTILRLTEPTSGEILFDGKNVITQTAAQMKNVRQEMQMIFQDPFGSLNPRMCVNEIIGEPLDIFKLVASKEEKQRRVSELMEVVGLAKRLSNTYPHELDGGRRQRIGIARALAVDPKFIVCDEPVSALDVSIQAQILNLMQDLQEEKGLAYMFITHDMSVVKHISEEICVMYLGQVVEYCETKQLFAETWYPYTKALLSAIPVPNIHYKKEKILLKGELVSPINPTPGCRFAPRCPHAADACFGQNPVLKEVKPGHRVACHRVKELNGLE